MTVLSHGVFAAQGAALVTEGLDKLDLLLGHHPLAAHIQQFQKEGQRITELTEKTQ
ncbi:MAG: hypothetical protein NTU49_04560 [Gammaproteobacteria bacterium]|nr:hypothetical protein [Gammaproteobacteria bacterium]